MKLFEKIVHEPDLEWVFIDGSHVRAHQHSSGARQQEQAISKSVGGNSSKIHVAVDSHGNVVSFIVSDGTTHDAKVAPDLIESIDLTETDFLSADRGYDSEKIRQQITQKHFRAIATRFDKLKKHFENSIALVCVLNWLKL